MTRATGLGAVVLAGLVVLGACTGGSGVGTGGPDGDGGAPPTTGRLTVLAAASLTEVFERIAADVEDEHPGLTVDLSFSASSTIVQQVNEGAPADVIALAGTGPLEQLDQEHRHGEVAEFTTNSLQLAVPPDNPAQIQGVEDLTEDGVRLVICEVQVPCGTATAALFQDLAIAPSAASLEHDVRAVLTKVELGEADVGVVYRTDVTAAGGRVLGVDLPEHVDVTTTYPLLALSDSPLAEAFVEQVRSERGQQRLTDAGFVPP